MNRKVMKVVSILLTVFMVVTMLSTSVFAADGGEQKKAAEAATDSYSLDQFKDASAGAEATTSVQKIIASIISIVQVIGTGVAIIMLIVLAIKYISAAPSEKAEIKKTITIYVVGAIVLFAASGLLEIVKNFAESAI